MEENIAKPEWVKEGALCNVNGDGTDKRLIHTVDEQGQRASVISFDQDIQKLKLIGAKQLWQIEPAFWESFSKLHREYLTDEEKTYNIIDAFTREQLEKPIRRNYKPKEAKKPGCITNFLRKRYAHRKDYCFATLRTDQWFASHYLAVELLGASEELADAIAIIVWYFCDTGFGEAISRGGYTPLDEKITNFLKGLNLHENIAKHYAATFNDWAEQLYREHLDEAVGRPDDNGKRVRVDYLPMPGDKD